MIKRYDFTVGFPGEGRTNVVTLPRDGDKGEWCRYGDIAPLEAKAALWPDMVKALELITENAPNVARWLIENDRGAYLQVKDVLTRARAMEGK